MNILLVYPETPHTFWSYKYVLPFISRRAAFPPLGLLTIAAMLPADWQLRLVDTNVQPLTEQDLSWADYVMISAMIVHKDSVNEIVQRCWEQSKTIIAGGPLFTTGHSAFPRIPHFVLGEAEEIIPRLIEDMKAGSLRHYYQSPSRPDITKVPAPRWDLIDLRHYATMAVQFSRGCPFDCEFCDIIIMNGRIPRTKTPAQLVHELEMLRVRGWNDTVFIVDDNFIGNKKLTKALLKEMIPWRKQVGAQMRFFTEASVNLVDDPELCELMVQTGFKKVFLGIETPSMESLDECGKLQNRGRDLIQTVKTLQRTGLEVMGGFIVGFDHDKNDIFKRQFEFIQQSGIVAAMVGLLTALPETRLYQRLMKEGRLEAESTGNNTDAVLNFKPILNREFLVAGYRELMRKLYEPHTYYQRVRTLLKDLHAASPAHRPSWRDVQAFLKSFWLLGIWHRGRVAYWRFFWVRCCADRSTSGMPLNWQFLATIFAKSPAAFEKRPADMGWIGFKDPCREKFTVRRPSRPLEGSSCFPSTSGSSGIPSKPAFWRNARIPFIAGKGSAKIYKQRRAKFCAARYFYAAGRPSQGCIEKKEKGNGMLWTIAVILFVLWLLGLVTSYTLGGLIHILLVVAIVVILLRVFSGRKGV